MDSLILFTYRGTSFYCSIQSHTSVEPSGWWIVSIVQRTKPMNLCWCSPLINKLLSQWFSRKLWNQEGLQTVKNWNVSDPNQDVCCKGAVTESGGRQLIGKSQSRDWLVRQLNNQPSFSGNAYMHQHAWAAASAIKAKHREARHMQRKCELQGWWLRMPQF